MSLEQLVGLVIGVLTVFGALFALRSSDKRELAQADAEQDERLKGIESAMRELRDEVHTHYLPRADIEQLRREIKADFTQLFERLNDLSANFNRYAGRQDARNGARNGD